jgi:phenylalanyl-tRNA synthetase beta chain
MQERLAGATEPDNEQAEAMKFSERWLREWVNPPRSTDELVELLTMAGLEVDAVERPGQLLGDLRVGEVLSVTPHPDADKLRVCSVSLGTGEPLQVVCGAPNVAAGGKYPLAPVGASLPGDVKIKKSKLRGVESFGMLCSARELGLSEDSHGLMVLPDTAQAGQPLVAALGLDDSLIEIDLTPNRGDCLGIAGIAREVGTLTRTRVDRPPMPPHVPTLSEQFDIDVQVPDACPRYLGRVLRGLNPHVVTPDWMRARLAGSGIRSLGPLVDVTNYVLLELGQPMHVFDMNRLSGGIRVRQAGQGETLTTLDERELTLDAETLVIADHRNVLAIAGVMGGLHSGVSDDTTDVFLECAFFTPEAIAGCARKYGLHTDSSHRFERGVEPGLQELAMERATVLLLEICGGAAGPVLKRTAGKQQIERAPVALRKSRIQRLLGLLPAADEVRDILVRLGMDVQREDDNGWLVVPPAFRFDISIEADLIEEIGRVYGYNRLPSVPMHGTLDVQPLPEQERSIESCCDLLVARGYQEAVTYSFVDPQLQQRIEPQREAVVLANPISSEMAAMRTSLWTGLLRAVQHNLNRQKSRVRFFEHGLRFWRDQGNIRQELMLAGVVTGSRLPEHWDGKGDAVGFFDLKQDVQALLDLAGREFRFVAAMHPALHPGQSAAIRLDDDVVGWLGRVHPQLCQQLDLDPSTCVFELEYAALSTGRLARFVPISRYPSIRRDLAVVLDEKIEADRVLDVVRAAAGGLLRELVVFDVYQGKGVESGRKSMALGLILQDNSSTLTEQEIESVVSRVTGRLGETLGATLRD